MQTRYVVKLGGFLVAQAFQGCFKTSCIITVPKWPRRPDQFGRGSRRASCLSTPVLGYPVLDRIGMTDILTERGIQNIDKIPAVFVSGIAFILPVQPLRAAPVRFPFVSSPPHETSFIRDDRKRQTRAVIKAALHQHLLDLANMPLVPVGTGGVGGQAQRPELAHRTERRPRVLSREPQTESARRTHARQKGLAVAHHVVPRHPACHGFACLVPFPLQSSLK